jgi:hypothetical protein
MIFLLLLKHHDDIFGKLLFLLWWTLKIILSSLQHNNSKGFLMKDFGCTCSTRLSWKKMYFSCTQRWKEPQCETYTTYLTFVKNLWSVTFMQSVFCNIQLK